jgi:hypothetical protein
MHGGRYEQVGALFTKATRKSAVFFVDKNHIEQKSTSENRTLTMSEAYYQMSM